MKTRLTITFLLLIAIGLVATCRNRKQDTATTVTETPADTSLRAGERPDAAAATLPEVYEDEGKTWIVGTADEVLSYLKENGIRTYRGPFLVTDRYDRPECNQDEPLDRKALLRLRRLHPEGIPGDSTLRSHDERMSQLHYAVTDAR